MNIKKTFVTIAAAVLAFTSISASAAVKVPQPKDNNEAYALAKTFYNDGFYYEAKQELEMVDPNGYYYDAEKTAAWMTAVDAKIEELVYNQTRAAVKAIIATAKKLNSEWKFAEALNVLYTANQYKITAYEYEQLRWWEEALTKNTGPTPSLITT